MKYRQAPALTVAESATRARTINIADAKARLPELVERAQAGETIIVARAGKPQVFLVPVGDPRVGLRVPGKGKGRFKVGRGFDAPLSEEVIATFEGKAR
ncbi:MAG: type II toxin-antitoxin system Phd/YefM family antitoxin [Polyangiales bacterium]